MASSWLRDENVPCLGNLPQAKLSFSENHKIPNARNGITDSKQWALATIRSTAFSFNGKLNYYYEKPAACTNYIDIGPAKPCTCYTRATQLWLYIQRSEVYFSIVFQLAQMRSMHIFSVDIDFCSFFSPLVSVSCPFQLRFYLLAE